MEHVPSLSCQEEQQLLDRFLFHLMNGETIGILVLDRHGYIRAVSDYACRVLGLSREKILYRHIETAFPGLSGEQLIADQSLLSGVVVKDKAISWTNNNQRYHLVVDTNTIQDEKGAIIGAYVLFRNVTHLRSLDRKIERNDRLALIGQIAAGAAHEIRNPLTSIQGFLQIMQTSVKQAGLDKEVTFIEIMLNEVHRINSLVSEFLMLSKPKDIQYAVVDLNEVLQRILPIVESQANLHGIQVIDQTQGKLPMVIAHSELLKQVFLNICKNGIESMEAGGTLTISYTEPIDGKCSINIHDTGIGIPHYIIDKIFDPFFTTKEEGTGLGLPICQKIIHDLGGQIQVSSKGYGTTFHILLPVL